jgi:hypothetical protein
MTAQYAPYRKRIPFIEFERDRYKIMPEIHNLFSDISDSNVLVRSVAKFLAALTSADILDEYKVAVNFINKKLHVSYKWVGGYCTDHTFNLQGKIISENATRIFYKEDADDYQTRRN